MGTAAAALFLIFERSLAYPLPVNETDVCAVILAGGQSSRMGCNKALLDFGGRPLIHVLIERILSVTDHIVISSNDAPHYRFLNIPVIPDQYKGRGPLAGLHAAMHRDIYALYVVLACDLPNLQAPFLKRLISLAKGFDAAIPRTRDGLAHPLCAVYRRTCLPAIEKALLEGENKVMDFLLNKSLAVRWVDPDEGQFRDSDLANINTPEDLLRFREGIFLKTGSSSICSS
jgi:molybdenum cofactor guanylyltransferase